MAKKNYDCQLLPYEREDLLSMQEVKQSLGWGLTTFDLPKIWDLTQGEGVIIGVLDTGCDLDHGDLIENLLPGRNILDPSQPPIDDSGHGSHICGILVASNNEIGVVGVCPKAKVIPVKVLDENGNGNMLKVAEGIRWAVDQGVHFLTMSLGTPIPIQQVRKAIQYAASKGVVCFCAAGNAGKKSLFYPANYPEVISIAAIDENMNLAGFSNVGGGLDFLAPGVKIVSCIPDDWYASLSGTSQAAPYCCGLAALLLSYKWKHDPGLKLDTADDYRQVFEKYSIPVQGSSGPIGRGIIDPRKFIATLGS